MINDALVNERATLGLEIVLQNLLGCLQGKGVLNEWDVSSILARSRYDLSALQEKRRIGTTQAVLSGSAIEAVFRPSERTPISDDHARLRPVLPKEEEH